MTSYCNKCPYPVYTESRNTKVELPLGLIFVCPIFLITSLPKHKVITSTVIPSTSVHLKIRGFSKEAAVTRVRMGQSCSIIFLLSCGLRKMMMELFRV